MKKILLINFLLIGLITNAQWLTQNTNFTANSTGIWNISIVNENVVWAAGYNGNSPTTPFAGYTKTADGGANWVVGSVNNIPTTYTFSNIMAIDANTAFACMYDAVLSKSGGIYKTTDGGINWIQQGAGTIYDNNSFPNFVHFWNGNKGVTMGDPNNGYFEIYTTSDGGATWIRTPSGNIPPPQSGEYGYVKVYDIIGDTIWYGTNKGRVYKSVDAGLNWDAYTTGLTDIYGSIAFRNSMEGIVTGGIGTTNTMAKTLDGGKTWVTVNPSGVFFTNDLSAIRDIGLYVSSGNGVSYSKDNGATWSILDSGVQRLNQGWLNATLGWLGGFNGPAGGGIYKYQANWPMALNNTKSQDLKINIYPNPAQNVLNIDLGNTNAKINLYITDALGRVVLNQINFAENSINISALKEGIYALVIEINGINYCKKIIKQ